MANERTRAPFSREPFFPIAGLRALLLQAEDPIIDGLSDNAIGAFSQASRTMLRALAELPCSSPADVAAKVDVLIHRILNTEQVADILEEEADLLRAISRDLRGMGRA